jgi:hypothetical protein
MNKGVSNLSNQLRNKSFLLDQTLLPRILHYFWEGLFLLQHLDHITIRVFDNE